MKLIPSLKPDTVKYLKGLSLKIKLLLSFAVIFGASSIYFLMQAIKSGEYPLWIALLKVVYSTVIISLTILFFWKKPNLYWIGIFLFGILFVMGTDYIGTIPHSPITQEMLHHKNKTCTIGGLVTVYSGFLLFTILILKEGVAKVKLETEMEVAKKIHSILVPPISLNTGTLEIYGKSVPIDKMGGDLIDTLVDKNKTLCLVADVSGHGISAGVVMGTFKSIVHTLIREDITLASLFSRTNSVLFELKEKKMFVTAAAICFLSSGEMEFSVAGHPPILHFQKRNGQIEQLKLKQVALGFVPRYQFTSRTASFEEGDIFVMVTDGLTETADKNERLLGLRPIEECINRNLDKPLPDICDAVFNCACKHGIADDDQTILLIKCLAPKQG
jgi:hypothetical protein